MTTTKRPPYVHLDQWYLRGVAIYGRLSPVEWQCLTVAWEQIAGWRGRERAAISQATFAQLTGSDPEACRRAVRTLSTPAGEVYAWARAPTARRMGHGLLVMERPGDARQNREAIYSLQLDWRQWGWLADTDLGRVAELLLTYHETPPETVASDDAHRLAQQLREQIVMAVGEQADVPIVQASSRGWIRWCMTFQRLLDRGWPHQIISAALTNVATDDHWGARVVGPKADAVFYDNFDSIHVRTQTALRRQRRG